MNKRVPAIISTVSNSFCDFTLDIAVNKYNMYFILFGTALGSFVIQLIYGIINGVSVTFPSLIFIIANGICMLLGYVLYVQALKRLPVALTGLIESGSLFAYLLIDFVCGYLKINLWFLFLFTMFMLSIFIFSYDTYKQKDENKIKKLLKDLKLNHFKQLNYSLKNTDEFIFNITHSDIYKSLISYIKPGGRILFRKSGTEDLCRIILESRSKKAIKKVQKEIEKYIEDKRCVE